MDFVALKHPTTKDDEWLVTPLDYFLAHGHIPDGHLQLPIPGVAEVADHTYMAQRPNTKEAGPKLLADAGIEVLHDPIWYFDPRFVKKEDRP